MGCGKVVRMIAFGNVEEDRFRRRRKPITTAFVRRLFLTRTVPETVQQGGRRL